MVTDELFRLMDSIVNTYPEGIVRVRDKRITGTAFFPGGDGLYKPKDFKKTEIMILGQDFGNECDFEGAKKRKSEKENKTWDVMVKLLNDDVPMGKCFFTNAIMGLREGVSKNTGRSKAFLKKAKNEQFLNECRAFFIEQIRAQKPKLIIGLGAHIPEFLSKTSDKLKDLSGKTSLSKIGKSIKDNLFKDVEFDGIAGYKTNVIFITHPSLYHVNADNRHKDGEKKDGKVFELELIKDAMLLLKA